MSGSSRCALQQRAEREASGLFFAEGTRFVAQAVEGGAEIETVVAAPGRLRGGYAGKLLHRLRRAGTPVLEVSPEVFHSFSLAEEPQGLAEKPLRWRPRRVGRALRERA